MAYRFRAALVSATLALSMAGCGGLNPKQELTWDAFKACQKEGAVNLKLLRVDGGSIIEGREGDVFRVINCMQEYRQKEVREGRAPVEAASMTINPAPLRPNAFVVYPPVWSVGDEWRFSRSTTAGRRSAFRWRVAREQVVDDVAYYVMQSGSREIFYRKSDLSHSHDDLSGTLDLRNTPPRFHFIWPLAVGASWAQTYRYERPAAQLNYATSYTGTVEAEETITVPAGTFRTLKVVQRGSKNTVFDERWYAPDVRMWARLRFPDGDDGEETRELLEFKPAARPAQAPITQSQAPAAKLTDVSTSSSSR